MHYLSKNEMDKFIKDNYVMVSKDDMKSVRTSLDLIIYHLNNVYKEYNQDIDAIYSIVERLLLFAQDTINNIH